MLSLAASVVLHNSFSPRIDTCVDPESLRRMSAFERAQDLEIMVYKRDEDPLRIEGYLQTGSLTEAPTRVRLMRSYDLAKLVQSGLGLLQHFPLPSDRNEIRIVDIDGQAVPVRLRARETGESPFVTGYIVAIGNDPVADPASAALRHGAGSIFRGPKPITILLIEAARTPAEADVQEAAILEWLTAAWREFRATCDPPTARSTSS